jgi:hypothetical protein
MIKEDVIQKLGLIDEGAQTGQSFMFNCQILLWPIRERFKVYVMNCDFEGKPLDSAMLKIFWKVDGKKGLINISYEAILNDHFVELYAKAIPE